MESKICKKCGNVFVPRTNRQIYCGKTIKSSCIVCGTPITYTCGTSHIPKTYGFKDCFKAATRIRYKKTGTRIHPIFYESFNPVNSTKKYKDYDYVAITLKPPPKRGFILLRVYRDNQSRDDSLNLIVPLHIPPHVRRSESCM